MRGIVRTIVNMPSKILAAVFVLALLAAVGWNYSTFFNERDYLVYTEVSCDPETESCFSWVCEEEDEECDDAPYKKITLTAAYAPLCDIYTDEECPEPSCSPLDTACEVIFCSEETLEEGEICAEPEAEIEGEDTDTSLADDVSAPIEEGTAVE